MRFRCIIFLALAFAVLTSCGGGKKAEGLQAPEEVRCLLRTVPSDALAIVSRGRCADALALLDSAALLRMPDYGRLEGSQAVISWSFNGELTPVLAVDAGRSQADHAAARSVARLADSLGLFSAYYAPDSLVGRHAVLVLTPSDAQLTAVRRHVAEGRSIMDAGGFEDAAAFAGNSRDFSILRNSGASRLLPKVFLEGVFDSRTAANFLRTVSDWVTITPDAGRHRIDATLGEAPSYYTNMFAALPYGDSRLGEILPSDTEFALSLPVPLPEFREAYRKYVDASVRYTQYVRELDTLEAHSGKNPLDWEKETAVQEVALIVRGGEKVAAVRPADSPENALPAENPWRGFIPALYGKAFSLPDDSVCAAVSGWIICGSDEAVRDFMAAQTLLLETDWPRKGDHIVIYKSGTILCWNKKGISLWSSIL